MGKVIEGDYKDCPIIETRTLFGSKTGIAISYGLAKLLYLNKETVKRWQIVTEGSDKDSASMALRGLGGGLLFGPIGALIGAVTTKSDGVILAIEFKDGKKSLITLEKEQFAKFKYSTPGEVTNIAQPNTAALDQHSASPDDVKTCPYCAETIKAVARICKHCRKEVPEDVDAEEIVAEIEVYDDFPPAPTTNVRPVVKRPPAESNRLQVQQEEHTPKKKRGCLRISIYCLVGFFGLAIIAAIFESPEDKQKRYAQEEIRPVQRTLERESPRIEQQLPPAPGSDWGPNTNPFVDLGNAPAMQRKQKEVVEIIRKYEPLYYSARNEQQRELIWREMAQSFVQKLDGYNITDWIGFVAGSESVSDAPQTYRTLTLTASFHPVMTFHTAYFVFMNEKKTMIPRESPLFQVAAGLKKGDWVSFSGKIDPDSLDYKKLKAHMSAKSGVQYPPIVLTRFSSIHKIR